MLSDSRIQYFLKTSYKDLKEGEYKELVEEYFQKPKSNSKWIEIEENKGSKKEKWISSKLKEFWKLIRKHTMTKGNLEQIFYFNNFIFPDFEFIEEGSFDLFPSFWEKDKKRVFNANTYFSDAKFLGFFPFFGVDFKGVVSFNRASFLGFSNFQQANFFGNANFNSTNFYEDVSFINVKFFKRVSFYQSKFYKGSSFLNSNFYRLAKFDEVEFLKSVNFSRVSFSDDASFLEVHFSSLADFSATNFLNIANFQFSQFSGQTIFIHNKFLKGGEFSFCRFSNQEETLFQDPVIPKRRGLRLDNINFTNKVIMRGVSFYGATFFQSDITEIKFKNCNWNELKGRILLVEEDNIIRKPFKDLEELYRQLKKNFEGSKDWELAGKAYVSEMEMRRKRFKMEFFENLKTFRLRKLSTLFGALSNYLIFNTYSLLGGYTQSYNRPLFAFLLLFFVSVYVYSDCFSLNYYCQCSFLPWKNSIDASLPFFKASNVGHIKWFYFQKISSTILLTFFILALRKRFKQ
ncbi:pentapeptide repeat-containing protein [Tenacibaculum sp. 190524A02b]|uniref:pentapeptide repeat-containing protein n=1 Tax=Tenacibaculum vairaonense TaxID=3137860 RepID=UPI0031FAF840